MNTQVNYLSDTSTQKKIILFFLALSLFCLPLSSTAKSIAIGLSVFSILSVASYRTDIITLFSTPWCQAGYLLFCIAVITSFWSPAESSFKLFVLEKYSKLLYLPFLVVGFQDKNARQIALHTYLFATLIPCLLSIMKFHGLLSSFNINPDHVFRGHVIMGLMVSFATYLSFLMAFEQKSYARYAYLAAALIFTYQLFFVSGGRTGYVLYFILMSILMFQIGNLRQMLSGFLLLFILFFSCYCMSPVMKMRVDGISQQLSEFKQNNKNTDIGLRLEFHRYASILFNRHPWLGNGPGSFSYYFNKEESIAEFKVLDPHSQYWFMASEFGLLGLVTLLVFFLSLLKSIMHLDKMKTIAFSLLLTFMIGNLSDSLLFYSGSGYFFILLMALCLGEGVEQQKNELLG